MFVSISNSLSFLFLLLISAYQFVVCEDHATPRQKECYRQINDVFRVESRIVKKAYLEYAILHLRYIGENPSDAGTFTRRATNEMILVERAPYKLYKDLTSEIIDYEFAVKYYDKIFNLYDSADILTPRAFCNRYDFKIFCLFQLHEAGFKENIQKDGILEYAYVRKVLSEFSEEDAYYPREYMQNIAYAVKSKKRMLWPEDFCIEFF